MNIPDIGAISKIAATYSIPPAILQAVLQQRGVNEGVPVGILTARGLTQSDVQDPDKQLEIVAQTLQEQFSKFGSWEKALSAYVSGDPNSYTSPTSSVGGFVYGVLGTAASNPAAGMANYTPADASLFAVGATEFGNHLQELTTMGGVASPAHSQQWLQASTSAFSRAHAAGGAIEVGQGRNATGPQSAPAAFHGPGENFPWGQCTWYAAGAASHWLTNTKGFGDAHNWYDAAQRNGYAVGGKPQIGAVVVYGQGGGYDPEAGHVGVVTGVNEDGTFQVTSDHWNGLGNTHIGTSTMSDVRGFIYAPDQDAANETAQKALKYSGQDPTTFAAQWNALASGGPKAQAQQQTLAQQQAQVLGTDKSKVNPPPPGKIAEFAKQLQGAGIDPDHFAQHFPMVAAMYRKYTQRGATIADYAPMAGMHKQDMIQHVLNQPHPTYLEHTIGAIAKWYDTAMLHSVPQAGRTPHLAEAAKFASAGPKWGEIGDFYAKLGQKLNQPTNPPAPPPTQMGPPAPTPKPTQSGMSPQRQLILDKETR